MSTVLNKLSPRPAYSPSAFSLLSLESQIEELSGVLNDTVETAVADAHEVSEDITLISRGESALDGVSYLTDSVVSAAKAGTLTEETAQVYRESMEAVIRASNLQIDVDQIVPSFESLDQYSTEAAEKKQNVIVRIFKWLGAALKRLVENVRSFFSKIFTNIPALEKLAKATKERIEALGAAGAPKDGSEINIGAQAQYLCDESGKIFPPATFVTKVVADYQKFVQDWDTTWGGLLRVKPPMAISISDELVRYAQEVEHAVRNAKVNEERKFEFFPGQYVLLTPSKDSKAPLKGVKVSLKKGEFKHDTSAPVLKQADMRAGIDVTIKAIAALDKLKKISDKLFDAAWENAKAAEIVKITVDESHPQAAAAAAHVDGINNAVAQIRGSTVALTSGLTMTAPVYLQAIRASLKYLNLSAKRYSPGSEGSKTEKYDAKADDDKGTTHAA